MRRAIRRATAGLRQSQAQQREEEGAAGSEEANGADAPRGHKRDSLGRLLPRVLLRQPVRLAEFPELEGDGSDVACQVAEAQVCFQHDFRPRGVAVVHGPRGWQADRMHAPACFRQLLQHACCRTIPKGACA